jgi:microcystin-dependent protein
MDPFIGEIRLMSFPFPPKGWQFCQGQLLPINQNQALFSLLGTTYGGNGTTTFGLPDLRGRVVLGVGSGPGLSPYSWGQQGGTEAVALTPAQMPPHGHTFTGTIQAAGEAEFIQPGQAYPATGVETQYSQGTPNATLGSGSLPNTLATAGSGQPHENRQPTLVLNYAIAVQGIYPSRN